MYDQKKREKDLDFVIIKDNFVRMILDIVFYQRHFIEFYVQQQDKMKMKIKYTLDLIRQAERVPEKLLKHLTGYQGLYEIRVEHQSNIVRIFCCFDKNKLVVLFNGFQKKSQKTPQKEIDKAVKLMEQYYNEKK